MNVVGLVDVQQIGHICHLARYVQMSNVTVIIIDPTSVNNKEVVSQSSD